MKLADKKALYEKLDYMWNAMYERGVISVSLDHLSQQTSRSFSIEILNEPTKEFQLIQKKSYNKTYGTTVQYTLQDKDNSICWIGTYHHKGRQILEGEIFDKDLWEEIIWNF